MSRVIAARNRLRHDHDPVPPIVELAGGKELRRVYRRLAVRVIALALEDLTVPGRSAADRASARLFFTPSWTLTHWCTLASVDPKRLVQYAASMA